MIFPARMRKLELLVLKDQKDKLIQDLYDIECVEISDSEVSGKFVVPQATRDCVSKAIQIDRMLNFFGHYVPEEKLSFLETLRGKEIQKRVVGLTHPETLVEKSNQIISKLDPKIKALEHEIAQTEEELDDLNEQLDFIERISELDVDIKLLRSTDKTLKMTGIITEQNHEDIRKAIFDATEGFCSVEFWKDMIFITTFKEKERSMDLIFSTYDIKPWIIPDFKGTPKAVLPQLNERIQALIQNKQGLIQEIGELDKEWEHELRTLKELLEIEAEKSNAFKKMAATQNVIALEGTYPLKRENELIDRILQYDAVILKVKEPVEEPSTLLSNKGFFKPFEILTELYGLPSYNEIDSTKFFAIFFTAFFGIMMTDFVYGILITAVGLFIVKNVKEGAMRDLGLILFYGGIATAVAGIAFGSYFGNFLVGEEYLNLKLPFLADPLYGAMDILIFSLGLGLLHLGLANILGLYQRVHQGNFKGAVYENVSWILMMIGIIGASIAMITGSPMNVMIMLAGGPMAFAMAIIFVGGLKGGLTGLITAFMSIPGFIGNWLSYARLLALALSTAGIGMVMNLFAKLAWNMSIGGLQIGIIFAFIMFMGGHVFNLAINGLGGFVHSLRLHYVEFFSYFYDASGKKFEPMKFERIYTKYVKEEG